MPFIKCACSAVNPSAESVLDWHSGADCLLSDSSPVLPNEQAYIGAFLLACMSRI